MGRPENQPNKTKTHKINHGDS
ncbi:hypothetical protein TIFTF001_013986, partial [Ficus carica]